LIKRSAGEALKHGALLGTRCFRSNQSAFPAGQTLRIESRMVYRDISGLGAYECRILAADREVASATLKVYEPDDFQTFLERALS
jgi:predicted hotdog family 3-hydroxylacyl-ACP dehydratase